MSLLLHPQGIGVPDWPTPFRFALASSGPNARVFEPFIATLRSDEEAWDALFDDTFRLKVFRDVYGNRKGKRRKTVARTNAENQGDLFATHPTRWAENVPTGDAL